MTDTTPEAIIDSAYVDGPTSAAAALTAVGTTTGLPLIEAGAHELFALAAGTVAAVLDRRFR